MRRTPGRLPGLDEFEPFMSFLPSLTIHVAGVRFALLSSPHLFLSNLGNDFALLHFPSSVGNQTAPKCSSPLLSRVHRSWWKEEEAPLRLLGLTPNTKKNRSAPP
ncbi:hypothetical protein MA16_Dca022372 [Dendrobium catenatum]|uniref:Uncharacterized protein n=1 Tax=Dendrobium catenatum TaxID=906689 RepID=A0A2I0VT80_9ASPA|nr:hypothetical protein MA16_Dca022372 [Dendrobium catenatum]